jgi:beta-lactamase class D
LKSALSRKLASPHGSRSKSWMPRSARSRLRDIIRLESREGKVLYGKTGWRFSSTPNLGWWTGWVEQNGKISAFALNIDMPAATDASKRVAIGKAMLAKLGVY